MVRILSGLALVSLATMFVALATGLYVGDLNGAFWSLRPLNDELLKLQRAVPETPRSEITAARERYKQAAQENVTPVAQRALIHVMVGMVATLAALLVACISVTYFVGTSKWCEEVADAYKLDRTLPSQSQRLKRQSFPWALLAFALLLSHACLGMMSYVSAGEKADNPWPTYHLISSYATIAVVAYAFYMQWTKVAAQSRIIGQMMKEVERIRTERGLPTEG